jgi:hypothetical protein
MELRLEALVMFSMNISAGFDPRGPAELARLAAMRGRLP